ncbi:hypothetical protein AOLI_G00022760 [Acnodon oligacanthus]
MLAHSLLKASIEAYFQVRCQVDVFLLLVKAKQTPSQLSTLPRPGLRALRSKFTILQPKHFGLTNSITACDLSGNLDPQRPYIDEDDKEVTEVQDCD